VEFLVASGCKLTKMILRVHISINRVVSVHSHLFRFGTSSFIHDHTS
jgi:hypothetical protein